MLTNQNLKGFFATQLVHQRKFKDLQDEVHPSGECTFPGPLHRHCAPAFFFSQTTVCLRSVGKKRQIPELGSIVIHHN